MRPLRWQFYFLIFLLLLVCATLLWYTRPPNLFANFWPAKNLSDLMLSPERQQVLNAGGTWAELFPPGTIQNRSQVVAVIFWWGFLLLLGWLVYPLVRLAVPGLRDRGYPLARLGGLLLLAYPTWLAGSYGMPVTRGAIAGILGLLALVSLVVAFFDCQRLWEEIRAGRRYIFWVEMLALAAFGAFLLVRLGNPDLWHIYFGGEKPMDFSYFNAVLKSETYPPYDPWFAGGMLNYYYYCFVIAGLPVKLLGITPAVAYNLILPTFFSLVILGAFSLGWNLNRTSPWKGGAFAALGLAVLGNLGAVRMVWQGWQRLVAPEEVTNSASVLQHIGFAMQGASRWLAGERLPYSIGDWYWIPSRAVIPAHNSEITEFPLFSFLYADPHAHLIALPVTLLVIAWCLSLILFHARWRNILQTVWGLAFGALVVGCLRAANSWDHPTYLALASLALIYARVARLREEQRQPGPLPALIQDCSVEQEQRTENVYRTREVYKKIAGALIELAFFIGLSFLFFAPFNAWFRQGYTEVLPWEGDHVNLDSYLTHWGLFLFILAAWLLDETIDWMAHTPLSALQRLKPYRVAGVFVALLCLTGFLWLVSNTISAAWAAAPLGLLCTLLLFRPGQPNSKRFVLFIAGTGLALTLLIELIVLQGDRMNTIFKFYFQAWTFLALSAAAGLAWLLPRLRRWWPAAQMMFWIVLMFLAAGCFFTTLTSTRAKIVDRMAETAPHTLDGMAYMDFATLLDGPEGGEGRDMDLSQDARAIRWMQQNMTGSPVIVEAHTSEYRHWGTRFTIYTGLPGIIGWANHQHQQRSTMPGDPVKERIQQVNDFYVTSDPAHAVAFLEQYQVEYIIVGQLERLYYPGIGLEKFRAFNGDLWNLVYSDGETEIYKVH